MSDLLPYYNIDFIPKEEGQKIRPRTKNLLEIDRNLTGDINQVFSH